MKTITMLRTLAGGLVLGMSITTGSVLAQDVTRRDMRDFHQFLENHPRIAQDLKNDPSLANDRRWVSRHDDLEAFLKDNPRIRQELRENPRQVMRLERNYDSRVSNAEMRKFDSFLNAHPRIAERLRANPDLINDRQFVQNHDELQAFLRDNPDIRRELQARPRAFMTQFDRTRLSWR